VDIACFQFIDHRIEKELPENFQDINFKDIEQQQAGFKGKCFLDACCTYFMYLSIGLHSCRCCQNSWENPMS
jgi:hypothetical protein